MGARRLRWVGALLAAVLAAGGCSGSAGVTGGGAAGGTDSLVEIASGDRRAAPELTGELLDGTGYDLSAERGKVVVVNFWASWCPPCRAEADDLEAVYQATRAGGVAFLGIDIRDDRDRAIAFHSGRTTYPSVFDPAGRLALDFDVPPNTIPATLIIDRSGRLAVVIRTAVRQDQLSDLVGRIAAEPAGDGTG